MNSGRSDAAADAAGPTRLQFAIHTFTARYLGVEDRVRLDCVDVEGAQQCILLTRRLARRVVPALSTQLDQKIPEGLPRDLAQDMRQESARQQRSTGGIPRPVVPGEQSPTWLCVTVHIKKTEAGAFVLVFTDDKSVDASIGMTEENFRALLDILHDMHTQAEWGVECFPEWYERRGPEGADAPTLN